MNFLTGLGTTASLAEVLVHRFNVQDGGNVNPRLDPHGELRNKNVLTLIPEKVGGKTGAQPITV